MYSLGIDTSCYTTSVAAVNEALGLCYDGRVILEVAKGGRGLRQSEAFFQHIRNMSRLIEDCMKSIDKEEIQCIAVSTKPRSTEGSYMPVFKAGFHMASVISSILDVPIIEVSHQDGHIQAGVWSSEYEPEQVFLAYHLSGGTTELLRVDGNEAMEIGGTSDLNAGQFIDRIGTAMGIGFPCGQEMDKLCRVYDSKGINIPISINGSLMSLSGPETHVQRILKDKMSDERDIADISKGVFLCIARSIEQTAINAKRMHDADTLLLVGGVSANSTVREYLTSSVKLKEIGIKPVFSDPRYSTDNAVGTAVLGMRKIAANRRNK